MMEVSMRMPDLGTVDDTIKVVKWLVAVGDDIQRGDKLLEVETDKSIIELESAVTGRLDAIRVGAGAEASAGDVLATFFVNATAPLASPRDEAPRREVEQVSPPPQTSVNVSEPPAPKGPRKSFFERNQEARAVAAPALAPALVEQEHSREFLLGLYERMVVIREFEDGVKFLFLEGAMPGTIHQCQGQEATAVGVCSALDDRDVITSTFRGHGHALAKGLTVDELLFELYGASTGCCRGKGGSMHVGNMQKGMVPGIAIVGGGIPLAAGMALALKMQKSRQVVACFFGDGAVAEGAFHEGVNLAAIWDLPVVFVCENNLYGASTRVDKVMRNPKIADRAAAYGIDGETVDGNDVLAVHAATRAAAEKCRQGHGPVLLELLTYRRTGHSRRDACHYQPKEERESWLARDPIERLGRVLVERGLATTEQLQNIKTTAQHDFAAAVERARVQPLPSPDDLTTDVFADSPGTEVPIAGRANGRS